MFKYKILIQVKKLVIVLLPTLLNLYLNAQKPQLYLKGGLNVSKFSSNNTDNFEEVNSHTGFNAGILAKLPLSKKIALQPALQISSKGARTMGGNPPYNSTYFNATTNPLYLELPVNIVFNLLLKEKSSIFFGAGFYGALGIGGKNKIDGMISFAGPFNFEKKIEYKSVTIPYPAYHHWAGIGYMHKEDLGLTATAGIQFKKLLFSVDYEYGLKNLSRRGRIVEDENKNRVLSFSIGYQLL